MKVSISVREAERKDETFVCVMPADGGVINCKINCEAQVTDTTGQCTFQWFNGDEMVGNSNHLLLSLEAGSYCIKVKATDQQTSAEDSVKLTIERGDDGWAHMAKTEVELVWEGSALGRKIDWTLDHDRSSLQGTLNEPLTPIYVPTKNDDSNKSDKQSDNQEGMAGFQKHWDDASAQARSTSKWIATVLGAALAALIGTAPLSGLQGKQIPPLAFGAAAAGLFLIAVTLFLVLRVLVPNVTGFGDIIAAEPKRFFRRRKFHSLQEQASRGGGVMLPIGIGSLPELGWRSRIESQTLDKLAQTISEKSQQQGEENSDSSSPPLNVLKDAQKVRGRWLTLLTNEITQWTSIGAYVVVKRAAGAARFWGLIFGVLGTAAIVWAFLQPQPKVQPSPLATYHITSQPKSSARDQAQTRLGANCKTFAGVVTEANEKAQTVTVLVKPSNNCVGASISLPIANLATGPAART
jgi:hypothetical protein